MRFFRAEEYQPLARETYDRIAVRLRQLMPEAVIEHIGSSAIQGASSKGDLDIYVGVDRNEFPEAIAAIESLGFSIKQGTLRNDELCPFESHQDERLDVGLQLVARGSRFEFFLRFRDLMNADPSLRERYNLLKRESEALDEYSYRSRKSDFIKSLLGEDE